MTLLDDFTITDTMIKCGGGFISRLGTLWRYADDDNQRRLKAAFPEYWTKYRDIALDIAKQHPPDATERCLDVTAPSLSPFPPVQLQYGKSPEWTCQHCGGDALFCKCVPSPSPTTGNLSTMGIGPFALSAPSPSPEPEWRKLKRGEWFYVYAPECLHPHAVAERTYSGYTVICTMTYATDEARAAALLIVKRWRESTPPSPSLERVERMIRTLESVAIRVTPINVAPGAYVVPLSEAKSIVRESHATAPHETKDEP